MILREFNRTIQRPLFEYLKSALLAPTLTATKKWAMDYCRHHFYALFMRLISCIAAIMYLLCSPLMLLASEHPLDVSNQTSSKPQAFTPKEIEWLEKKQPVTYVYDPDWAPFEWKNDIGNHTGIIFDVLNLIRKNTGINLIPVNTDTWEESVELVNNGKVEMFSAITQNSTREEHLDFTTKDIFSYPAVLVTKFDDKKVYLDLEKDFKGKTIGIVKGSGLGKHIKDKHPELEYMELPATNDGFHAIRSNKIDLFAINTVTAKYYIEKKGFDDLKIGLKLDYYYHLKIALRKGLPKEIVSILDKSLASISEEELNDIFNKWTEVATEYHTDWKLPLQICSVLLILVLFLLWNNRRLNRIVETRTEELSSNNIKLSKALNEIKTLRGIIPICSYCHSIRNEEGAWNQLEAYLAENSDAEFSHGICPKCIPKALSGAELDDDS